MSGKLFAAAIAAIAAGALISAPVNAAPAPKASNKGASQVAELSKAIHGDDHHQSGGCKQYASGLLKKSCEADHGDKGDHGNHNGHNGHNGHDDHGDNGHCNPRGHGHEIGKGKGHDRDDDCPVSG